MDPSSLLAYLSESCCPNNSLNINSRVLSEEEKRSAQSVVDAINKLVTNNNECPVELDEQDENDDEMGDNEMERSLSSTGTEFEPDESDTKLTGKADPIYSMEIKKKIFDMKKEGIKFKAIRNRYRKVRTPQILKQICRQVANPNFAERMKKEEMKKKLVAVT